MLVFDRGVESMNIISFFSGAGGMDLGFKKAGFNINLAVEIDPIMCQTLENNFKDSSMKIYQQNILTTTSKEILEQANIYKNEITGMIGGSPCQSFSTAGKRTAFEDERGQAMIKYIDLINEIQPVFFVLENVKGLLSAALKHIPLDTRLLNKNQNVTLKPEEQPGSAFQFVLNRIKGYELHYKVLNSADYGVPQKRERVFLIGIRKDFNNNPICNYEFPIPTHSKDIDYPLDLFSLTSESYSKEKWISFQEATAHLDTCNMNFQKYSENRLKYMKLIPKGGGNWRDLKQYGETLVKDAMKGAYKSGGGKVGFFRRIKSDEPAPTLLTSPSQNSTNLGHPFEDRPLSIEEYLAIQQFPQDYKVAGTLMEQYKQIGNAVPVGLAYAVANSIKQALLREQHKL